MYVAKYNAGIINLRDIATQFDVTQSTVFKWLRQNPCFKSRKIRRNTPDIVKLCTIENMIIDHKDNGLTIKELAVKYGYVPMSVRRLLHSVKYDFKAQQNKRYWNREDYY